MKLFYSLVTSLCLGSAATAQSLSVADFKLAGATPQMPVRAQLTYNDAWALAKANRQPFIIWCNCDCVPCRVALTDCVHVHVTTFDGSEVARVVVGIPNESGTAGVYYGEITGTLNTEKIRAKIAETKAIFNNPVQQYRAPVAQAAPQQYYQPQQQYYSAPQQYYSNPSYFGGGGGFFRGGGGASCGPRG